MKQDCMENWRSRVLATCSAVASERPIMPKRKAMNPVLRKKSANCTAPESSPSSCPEHKRENESKNVHSALQKEK